MSYITYCKDDICASLHYCHPAPVDCGHWSQSMDAGTSLARRITHEKTMSTIEKRMKQLSPSRRKKVEARAKQLVAEEMTLQELRRAHHMTQVRIAKSLGISQDGVSRLEKRSDLLLSTLQEYVHAMGGSLSLVATFPDGKPVVISGISGIGSEKYQPV
jgi:DNA-binding XRE family transcriptional regulator